MKQGNKIGTRRRKWENAKQKRKRRVSGLTPSQLKRGVLDGTIPSAISDTGATSTAGKPGDPYTKTGIPSSKVFHLPDGSSTKVESTATLQLPVRAPANQVDIVPNLQHTLLSGVKMADAGYTAVYDKDEVNFYNNTAKITVNEEAVLKGWRCPRTGLWRVPLQENVSNDKTLTHYCLTVLVAKSH